MAKSKLPCIDCITYTMCRNEYLGKIKKYKDSNDLTLPRKHLMIKCSLLHDWVYYIKKYGTSYNDFHDYFYYNPPL
jgi:hypothetical protein